MQKKESRGTEGSTDDEADTGPVDSGSPDSRTVTLDSDPDSSSFGVAAIVLIIAAVLVVCVVASMGPLIWLRRCGTVKQYLRHLPLHPNRK